MTADQFPFKILFWFENDTKIITEIKRTDIQSEDKSVIYKWIIIQNEKQSENEGRISLLTFQSMAQDGDKQVRGFAEGILEWDETIAHFNGEAMTPIEAGELSGESLELISHFLGTS